jgi:hypothetical protein
MSEELYNSNDYCKLAEELEELKKENAELARDKDHLMNLFMESSEYVFNVVSNMKINDLGQKCKRLEADYEISNRELLVKQVEITALRAELESKQRWIPVSEKKPLNEVDVFGYFNNGDYYKIDIVCYYAAEDVWTADDHVLRRGAVTYWFEMPELPDEVHWDCKIAQLEAELKITDELLKEATETIGAVVACCTYNSNDDAKIGIYGIDQKAFTRIDKFITHYNDAVSAGKVSVDVKTSTDNNKGE